MTYYSSRACIWYCVYVTFIIVTIAVNEDRFPREILSNKHQNEGNPKIVLRTTIPSNANRCPLNCTGPVAQYKSLNCKPIYSFADSCCPVRYECKPGDRNRCFVNGHKYNIGQRMKEKDALLCEEDCVCRRGIDGIAEFNCPAREKICPKYIPTAPGCYQRNSVDQCCPTEEICIEQGRGRPVCYVDGHLYSDGQYVLLRHRPDLICVCQSNNSNSAQARLVCVKTKRWFGSDLHAAAGFYKGCVPVYLSFLKNMIGNQRMMWRCPNRKTDLIFCRLPLSRKESAERHARVVYLPKFYKDSCNEVSQKMQEHYLNLVEKNGFPFHHACQFLLWHVHICIFGEMTLHIGDQLNDVELEDGACISCTCQIPPILTCVYRDC